VNKGRTRAYKRNEDLLSALSKVNTAIKPISIGNQEVELQHAPIFIMGCARSGSTLLMQWLANTRMFTFPSNLISRFYSNPAFGAYVQKILLEYDDKNQIFNEKELQEVNRYQSNLGHSKGPLAPSEFWYFWRQHFQFGEINFLKDEELDKVNTIFFLNQLSSFEAVDEKPLLLKGMILNWNIPFLYRHLPNAIFIHLERDPFFVAQSLIESRIKFFDDINKWWSFKPKEYDILKNKSPYEQVVGQVYFTNKAILEGIENLPKKNKIHVRYEEFCERPKEIFDAILKKVFPNKIVPYNGEDYFNVENRIRLNIKEEKQIKIQIEKYYKD